MTGAYGPRFRPSLRATVLHPTLFCLVLFAASLPAEAKIHHELSLRLDPRDGTVTGTDRVAGDPLRGGAFTLAEGMLVDRLVVDGKPVSVRPDARQWQVPERDAEAQRVEVDFHGRVDSKDATTALISGSGWYPTFGDELVTYQLEVSVPAGFVAVSPGKIVFEEKSEKGYRARFLFDVPGEGISLFAGPYEITERMHGGVRLRTYLHAEVADLADVYLSKTGEYIDLYAQQIGAYPYTAFHVVSAVSQVGLGFPGLTYMGTQVLRLPFIPDTSLGHEVLHSWWGNGVFVDPSRGNWAEGLTTFMADYAYAERQGEKEALEMRLRWLREYAALPADQDRPLTSFRSRQHIASQAVGYHKAAMVFLMLRDEIGRDLFMDGIRRFWKKRRFQPATWTDLQTAFEAAAGKNLDGFFSQWIERVGAPKLRIESAGRRAVDGRYEVVADLAQQEPVYRLEVPVTIETEAETDVTRQLELGTPRQRFTLHLDERPLYLQVDPRFRLFRRLDASELPPILRNVAFASRPTAAIATDDAEATAAARTVATSFFEDSPEFVAASDTLPAAPVLVVGTPAAVAALLARNGLVPPPISGHGSARAWAARRSDRNPYVVVEGDDAEALRRIAGPLPHYGSQSFVVFEGRKAVDRGIWPVSGSPLRVALDDRP